MKYYQSGEILIQYNPETGVYKRRNNVERINTCISQEDFNALPDLKTLKKDKFSELMNIWFSQVEHSWVYNGESYRKLPNFENNGNLYDRKIPNHTPEEKAYLGMSIMVYHWGQVYLYYPGYQGTDRGQLENLKTGYSLRWAKMKHLAPIFNETLGKII